MIRRVTKECIYHFRCLLYSIVWLIKMIFRGGFFIKLPRIGADRKLLVLGNGPSLRDALSNITPEDGEDIAVVNNFCNSSDFLRLHPMWYVFIDPAFFYGHKEKERNDLIMSTIDTMKAITWNMYLLVPKSAYAHVCKIFQGTKVHPVTYAPVSYNGWKAADSILFKLGFSMPPCQNVLIGALGYGMQVGYKSIDLYGADHSWFSEIVVNDDSQLCIVDHHFYENEEIKLKPWRLMDGSIFKMSHFMKCMYIAFSSYDRLAEYARNMNVKIVNYTRNSFIDSFTKNK